MFALAVSRIIHSPADQELRRGKEQFRLLEDLSRRLIFLASVITTSGMKQFFLALLVGMSLCLPFRTVSGASDKPEEAAQPVVTEWLALVDAGKFDECWEKMSPGFKKAVSKRKWSSTASDIRKATGAFSSRKLKSATYSKELPGAPEGEYVVLEYESVFANKPVATEKVTLILGRDLYWRVSSYAVK